MNIYLKTINFDAGDYPASRLLHGVSEDGQGEQLSYDKMGNILSLMRTGVNSIPGASGSFSYSYVTSGNRLQTFTNGSSYVRNYTYDGGGRITADGLQKTVYNEVGLPKEIKDYADIPKVSYIYDAAGRKLRKVTPMETRTYVNGVEYVGTGSGATVDILHTEEGIARRSGSSYVYEYILRDHLGNNRLVHNGSGTILQEMDYYPFGLEVQRKVTAPKLEYTYNGKEWQQEAGQFDYGARFYDPVVGRWNVVDPLAEQMRRHSPYNYGFNNPIRFVDPDGRRPVRTDPPAWSKGFRAAVMNLLSGQSGSSANSSIPSIDRQTASINRVLGTASDVQAVGQAAVPFAIETSAMAGQGIETAGTATMAVGYTFAPFTNGSSLTLVPVGTALTLTGMGLQIPKMLSNEEYGRVAFDVGSYLLFRETGKVFNKAQSAGKITKTDNDILQFVNEMWSKTSEILGDHVFKFEDEDERESKKSMKKFDNKQ